MPKLYNQKTRAWEDVLDADTEAAVASGQFDYPAGYKIPVVNPKGEAVSIGAEQAYDAFRNGYRIAAPKDTAASAANEEQKILREHFDSPATAFAGGAASALSFGGSDAALRLGEETGVLPQGVVQARQMSKDLSPVADIAGQVLGSLAGPGAALSSVAKARAAAATAGIAQPLARTVAQATTTSALEGVGFGLGQGISEASLGNPEDAAETILANGLYGGLFGTAFGGAVGAVSSMAPLYKKIAGAVYNKADEIAESLAERAARLRAPALRENAELGALAGDFDSRSLAFAKEGELADLAKQGRQQTRELDRLAAKETKALERVIRNEPDEVVREVRASLTEAGNDLDAARSKLLSEYNRATDSIKDMAISDMTAASSKARGFVDELLAKGKTLEASPSPEAKVLGRRLLDTVDNVVGANASKASQVPHLNLVDDAMLDFTAGKEFLLGWEARQILRQARGQSRQLDERAYRTAYGEKGSEGLLKTIDDAVLKNPNQSFGKMWLDAGGDSKYAAMQKLNEFVTGKRGAKALRGDSSTSVLRRITENPEKKVAFDRLINNVEAYLPDFAAARSKLTSASEKTKWANEFRQKFKDASELGDLADDDLVAMARAIAPRPAVLKKADTVEKLRTTLGQLDGLSTEDKYLRVAQALGRPVANETRELLKAMPAHEILSKYKPKGGSAEDLIDRGTNIVAGLMGARIPIVGKLIAPGLQAVTGGSNPYRTLKALTSFQESVQKAARNTERATNAAIDGIFSPLNQKVFTRTGQIKNVEERRSEFKKQAETLKRLQTQQDFQAAILRKSGGLNVAPSVEAAASNMFKRQAEFLSSKLPEDPLAQFTVMGYQSDWHPSDTDLAKFERYSSTVENPMGALDHLAAGTITTEEAETLRAVYPGLYNNLQKRLFNAIVERGAEIPYSQRLNLSTMFDLPVDPTMSPQFLLAMQTSASQQTMGSMAEADNAPQPVPQGTNIDIDAEAVAAPTDRVTYKT